MSQKEAYLFAGGVSLCAVLLALFHHPYFYEVQRVGMWLRISCCSLIYKKVSGFPVDDNDMPVSIRE